VTGATPTGDIFLVGGGGWPSTTNGCNGPTKVEYGGSDVDIYVLEFITAADKYCQWQFGMPDDWDGGTITAEFYWTTAEAVGANNTVRWGAQGRSYGDSDAIDQAWGGAVMVDDDNLLADDVMISGATGNITLAGTPAAGELVVVRAQREGTHGNDKMPGTARLIIVKLNYTRS